MNVKRYSREPRFLRLGSSRVADILAALIDGKGIWYLIPARALKGRKVIHLYPFGCTKGRRRFEKYREAWWLLEKKKKNNNARKRSNPRFSA